MLIGFKEREEVRYGPRKTFHPLSLWWCWPCVRTLISWGKVTQRKPPPPPNRVLHEPTSCKEGVSVVGRPTCGKKRRKKGNRNYTPGKIPPDRVLHESAPNKEGVSPAWFPTCCKKRRKKGSENIPQLYPKTNMFATGTACTVRLGGVTTKEDSAARQKETSTEVSIFFQWSIT